MNELETPPWFLYPICYFFIYLLVFFLLTTLSAHITWLWWWTNWKARGRGHWKFSCRAEDTALASIRLTDIPVRNIPFLEGPVKGCTTLLDKGPQLLFLCCYSDRGLRIAVGGTHNHFNYVYCVIFTARIKFCKYGPRPHNTTGLPYVVMSSAT